VETTKISGDILKAFNSTFIILIPKDQEANSVDKFRSISLCNVIYKIITKIIANHLKPIMSKVVS
jgi:hypothetical protein